jgi:hypothetical protein
MNGNNIFDLIVQGYNGMTRSEIKVADYVLKHRPELPHIMIRDLADALRGERGDHHPLLPHGGLSERSTTSKCCRPGPLRRRRIGPASGYDIYGDVQAEDSIEQKCQKLYHVGTQALQQTFRDAGL